MPRHQLIPLIIASALFLQQIDATALATSLPAIGAALGATPVQAHIALTAYMFSVAAFVPISGWVADRFGARLVFRLAIAIFTLSSLACGLSSSLEGLAIARVFQGIGGSMMMPVGRLILLRSVEKGQVVKALALMGMPATAGPILGPLVGGFLTTYASWRWVFWVNLPIGIAGIILVSLFIPDVREETRRRFDPLGVTLLSFGLSTVLLGIDGAATNSSPGLLAVACLAIGAVALVGYVVHARRREEPVIDLGLFRVATFRSSMIGGSIFRLASGAMPFLLPLLFQQKFGYTPAQSGAITFVSAIGTFGTRTLSARILRRFGFRSVLMWNALIAAMLMAVGALMEPSWPTVLLMALLLISGFFRSLELSGINALTFANLDSSQMSHGTTLSTMAQRLSQSLGVAVAASVLHLWMPPAGALFDGYSIAFLVVGGGGGLAGLLFARLAHDAGSELSGHVAASHKAAKS